MVAQDEGAAQHGGDPFAVGIARDGDVIDPAPSRLGRARVNQIIGIVDNYAYRSMIWGVFMECVRAPARGKIGDEEVIASSLNVAETCLDALEDLAAANGPALLGSAITLADLFVLLA